MIGETAIPGVRMENHDEKHIDKQDIGAGLMGRRMLQRSAGSLGLNSSSR